MSDKMKPAVLSEVFAAEEPHPEVVAMLEQRKREMVPPFRALSPEDGRRILKEMGPPTGSPEPVDEIREFSITEAAIPIRVYVPDGEGPYPTFVHLHGGGWVPGDLDSHDPQCRAIANEAGYMVVSVGYRRAPEHPFPHPLEDSYAAAKWVFDHADGMHIDTDTVVIGGSSAGGNLAAGVTLMARDKGGPSFARQVLLYPATNYGFDAPSYEENAEGYFLTRADVKWFWDQYLRDDVDGVHPYASPLRARSLDGSPPPTVVTCGFDPIRDGGPPTPRDSLRPASASLITTTRTPSTASRTNSSRQWT